MQARTKQGLHVMRQAHVFLTGQRVALAMGEMDAQAATLGAIVERLEEHARNQDAMTRRAREATEKKLTLARSLIREYLEPLALMAALVFDGQSTQRHAFRVQYRPDDELLLQTAAGMADRCKEHRARFVAHGLAENFVERLEALAAEVRAVTLERSDCLGRRSAASAGLLTEVARGRLQLKVIDRMITPRLERQPALLAEWRTITRVVRRGVGGVEAEVGAAAA
jgi:hypothetical protein